MRFSSSPTAIYFLGLFSVMLGSFPCTAWSQESLFQDISQAVGIDLEGLHHATAIGDYDRDGFQDIYVGTKNSANKLFRNLGNMEFQEVAVAAGVDDSGNTQATIWGDFNNDGYLDLVNGNYLQSNRFYQNNGDGTFSDMTAALGIGNLGPCRSLHAADYDQDGWLDLYVVNINSHSVMWRNLNGTGFQNTTFPSGTVDVGIGMGSLFFDADNDGDVDLYLTHDGNQVNRYYRNDGDGTFTEAAAEVGLDYQGNCMGVDAADINHDGWMDLYITDLYPSELFINDGDGTFTAIGEASGVDDTGMTWGCAWFDYDNDSETDLYIVNDYAFAAYPNLLYRGLGGLAFEITSTGIPDLEHPFQDYGMAQGDLDGDGDLDVAIATSGSSIQPGFTVLENLNATGHAAHIRLEGTVSNRDAIGARVTAYFDNQVRTDEVHCGQGYSGSSSFQVHFGLGESTSLDSVVIRWPNGIVSQQGPLDADTLYHIL
ncbi:MAG: CRTAC1 family protein, partial [Flavobacteriales bacterium]|nr:CRTAC1 family protein [Flavobacteriales bacterium]